MKNKTLTIIAFSLVLFLSISLTSAAVIRTIPVQSIWYADGVTQYQVHVFVDGLGVGEISGAEWRFLNTPNLNFIGQSLPAQNDFFEGYEMFWELVAPPNYLSGRLIAEGIGPISNTGYVGTYTFSVPIGTSPGQRTFDLTDTGIFNGNGDYHSHTIQNMPFTIRSPRSPIAGQNIIVRNILNATQMCRQPNC